jgi:two-component system response regulator NreC
MRTLIVEDQRMFRDLLAKVCEVYFRFEAVRAVGTGAEAEEEMKKNAFDLLILDIDLPDRDGFSLAEMAAASTKPPRVLGMSAFCDEFMAHRVMNSDMHGFVDKTDQSVDTLREAITAVCAGRFYFTEAVLRIQRALRDDPRAFPKLLTERECQFLCLFGGGMSSEEAGARLGTTTPTAHWHRKQIMRKLGIHSTVELMRYATEKGFSRMGGGRPIYPLG